MYKSLPNHLYRYYAIYALPPFLCALAVVAHYAFERAARGRPAARRIAPGLLCAFLALTTCVSTLYVRQSVSGVGEGPARVAAHASRVGR